MFAATGVSPRSTARAARAREPLAPGLDARDWWIVAGLAAYVLGLTFALPASGVRLTQEDGVYDLEIAERLSSGPREAASSTGGACIPGCRKQPSHRRLQHVSSGKDACSQLTRWIEQRRPPSVMRSGAGTELTA
jgi:hypothetical protein